MRSTIRPIGRVAVMAAAACLGFGMLGGAAFAAPDVPDLKLTLAQPAAVAPGGTVDVQYTLENVSKKPTKGILLNMSLPPHVSFGSSPNCKTTGKNDEGGTLVSCNISGPEGKIAAGKSVKSTAPFKIAQDAPAGTDLGKLGALVVPLGEGAKPTEDWHDITGPNAAQTTISTSAGAKAAR